MFFSPHSEFRLRQAVCCAFFAIPGLCYSLLTARMPALKENASLTDMEIGTALLLFGVGGSAALLSNDSLLKLVGDKRLLCVSATALVALLTLTGLCRGSFSVYTCFILTGFCIGVLDCSANAQGMLFETTYEKPAMNLFHAFYSLGAVAGSLAAAAFAAFKLSIAVNFFVAGFPFLVVALALSSHLYPTNPPVSASEQDDSISPSRGRFFRIPWFIAFCGVCALLAYCIEGSAGEWGALYLTQYKNASASTAALVYGLLSVTVFVIRIFADRLRLRLGDALLLSGCGAVAFCGMTAVLLSSTAFGALAGYVPMGVGLSPLVPTLFSLGARCKALPLSKTSALIGIFAYSGLLIVPPTLGWLAARFSLQTALCFVLILIALFIVLSLRLFFPGVPAAPRSTKTS